MANPGAASTQTVNTQPPVSNLMKIEALSVNVGVVAGILTITATEITFSGLGTGLLAGDTIISVNKPTAQAGLGIAGFRVDPLVNDKFYITYVNPTAGTLTPTASEIYTIVMGRPVSGSAVIAAVV